MRALPTVLMLLTALAIAGGLAARPDPAALQPGTRLQEPVEAEQQEEAADPEEIRRELAAARRELALQHVRRELALLESAAEVFAEQHALEVASAALIEFETYEHAAQLAESALALQMEKDAAQDAREEMEQLEVLYGVGDLADKTAEIVLRRAARGLERADEMMRLEEAAHRQLLQVSLPRQHSDLRFEVHSAELDLRRLEAQRQVDEMEHAHAVASLGEQIAGLEEELKDAETETEGEGEEEE
jgi:hypothetical protein